MIIKILGAGCSKCDRLQENLEKVLKESGINAKMENVVELKEIVAYGVMATPGLVVDEKLVSAGKVLSVKELGKILNI